MDIFFSKEDIKRIINENRKILKSKNEENKRKVGSKITIDTFDELSSTALNENIIKFTKRAEELSAILSNGEFSHDLNYLKDFFTLDIKKKFEKNNSHGKIIKYNFPPKEAAVIILALTFVDNFGFTQFFYNGLISSELKESSEIALRNIDLFTLSFSYDNQEKSDMLSFKKIEQIKKDIADVLKRFLEGVIDPKEEEYKLLSYLILYNLNSVLSNIKFYPNRLSYMILQTYIQGAVENSKTLIEKHILENNRKKVEEIFKKEHLSTEGLEQILKNHALISKITDI